MSYMSLSHPWQVVSFLHGKRGYIPSWDTKYALPFSNAYQISCRSDGVCRDFPNATSVRFYHSGGVIAKYNFDSVCGNGKEFLCRSLPLTGPSLSPSLSLSAYLSLVHFPPNADRHYNTTSLVSVLASCQNFGFGFAKTAVTANLWKQFGLSPYKYTDCGGEFLTWWYQRMPWQGAGHRYASGAAMPAVGPFLFY
jgi:hypothetical protein